MSSRGMTVLEGVVGTMFALLCMGALFGIYEGMVTLSGLFSHADSPPKPPPPLIIGHAPVKPTGHINVSQSADSEGYAAPQDWPKACDFLTDQDIRSIFPQVTGQIQHQATDAKFKVVDDESPWADEQFDVPRATCNITFDLPASGTDQADGNSADIDVSVQAVGDPDTLRQNLQLTVDSLPGSIEGCTYRSGYTDYLCGRVEVAVDIGDLAVPDDSQQNKTIDRFQVGGKITSFDVSSGSANQQDAEQKFEDTSVAPEIVKAMLAKLPAS